MMIRKYISAFLSVVLVMSCLTSFAFADSETEQQDEETGYDGLVLDEKDVDVTETDEAYDDSGEAGVTDRESLDGTAENPVVDVNEDSETAEMQSDVNETSYNAAASSKAVMYFAAQIKDDRSGEWIPGVSDLDTNGSVEFSDIPSCVQAYRIVNVKVFGKEFVYIFKISPETLKKYVFSKIMGPGTEFISDKIILRVPCGMKLTDSGTPVDYSMDGIVFKNTDTDDMLWVYKTANADKTFSDLDMSAKFDTHYSWTYTIDLTHLNTAKSYSYTYEYNVISDQTVLYSGTAKAVCDKSELTNTYRYLISKKPNDPQYNTYSATIPEQTDAGSYTYKYCVESTSSVDSGYFLYSHEVDKQTFTFKIEPQSVTINAENISKKWGSDDPELTYNVSGFVNYEHPIEGSLVREAGEDVGEYSISQGTVKLTSSNYVLEAFNGATFTIEEVYVPVTIDYQDGLDPVTTDFAASISMQVYLERQADRRTYEGRTIVGWYTNPDLTEQYDYSKPLGVEPLTIYAKWGEVEYSFIEGAGSVWVQDSNDPLVFRASRNVGDAFTIDHFTGIEVDGTGVGTAAYDKSSGSVIISLKVDYLKTLSLGEHTIKLGFNDADPIETTFTIKAADPSSSSSPQTGESAGTYVLAAAGVLMTLGAVMAVKAFRKREEF